MERTTEYDCPHCGERITLFVDPADGHRQKLVEDCQVCCRANEITIEIDPRAKSIVARAQAVDV